MKGYKVKSYRVIFGELDKIAVNLQEIGCGFAFMDDAGNLQSVITAKEAELLRKLNDDLAGCIKDGIVTDYTYLNAYNITYYPDKYSVRISAKKQRGEDD